LAGESLAPVTTSSTQIQLKNISAGYGAMAVLRDLCLEVGGGELIVLLGPSGCGKTTLLKVIAGLIGPTSGDLLFGDRVFTGVPAERREAAMVFQKPLLFPHLTVAENVAFGLKMRKIAGDEMTSRVAAALEMVQLEGFGERKPRELSGGQEQRISLARALVTRPRVLLLDEPFSALDVRLRTEMRSLVRQLQMRLRITTVFVTHDQDEAVTIADRIALLLEGEIVQVGKPRDFYISPRTPEAARFFGWKVLDGPHQIAFHPDNIHLAAPGAATKNGLVLKGKLEGIIDIGARLRFVIALGPGNLIEIEKDIVALPGDFLPKESGEAISVCIPSDSIIEFKGG
jgi:ABC-type Fe3+/spermidine/putrescine transport system ATPase subunit